jgi:hypothetical protein
MKDDAPNPHFKFIVIGRTKGVQQDGKTLGIPCVKVTKATAGLRPGVWVKRLLDITLCEGDKGNCRLEARSVGEAITGY